MARLSTLMCMVVGTVVGLLATTVAASSPSDVAPQQVMLSMAGKSSDGMAVAWVTVSGKVATEVHYGTSPSSLNQVVKGTSTTYTMYTYTSNHIHHAVMQGLGNNKQVFYQVGDSSVAGGLSDVHNFTTAPAPGDTSPFHLSIVGDLGQTKYSAETLQHIMESPHQAVMIAGDLSYADLDEQRWDSWGQLVEPSTSFKPWMLAPGNHEISDAKGYCAVLQCGPLTGQCYADFSCKLTEGYCEHDAGCDKSDWDCIGKCMMKNAGSTNLTMQLGQCFVDSVPACDEAVKGPVPPTFLPYDTRFRMPWAETGAASNQYYSWETSMFHVTVLNSYAPYLPGTPQHEWLLNDLASVDRTVTPWLFVVFHCPWYNSDVAHHGEGDAMKAALEKILYNNKVGMVFSGHVHAYERTYPVYNNVNTPGAPTYIVVGDGGNREGLATSYYPQPSWSAFRQAHYGHGQLMVANATTLRFQWHIDIDNESVVTDQVWVTNPWVSK